MKLLFPVFLFLSVMTIPEKTFCQTNHIGKDLAYSIDTFVERKMNKAGIVGLAAAIIVNKKIVWSKGYGYADKDTKKPFTVNTLMNIGSTAKNFTGVCLMRAVEENKVSLDEDINKYLPFKVVNPYFPNEKITIRQIATHTSSLADRYPFYDDTYKYAGEPDEELGSFLKNYFDPKGQYYSKENFLEYKPGSYYQYSNIPAALAGYIVERVTGKKLPEYGKEVIFKPLDMKATGWRLSDIRLSDHSKLYARNGDTLKNIPLYTFPTYPEGGVRTSVAELSKYFITLLNEGEYEGVRIFKKESMKAMQTFQFDSTNKPVNMNLKKLNSGIFWATKLGATRIGHNGSDPGVRVFMLTDPNREVAVIMFINTSLTDERISFDIYEYLHNSGFRFKNY